MSLLFWKLHQSVKNSGNTDFIAQEFTAVTEEDIPALRRYLHEYCGHVQTDHWSH